MLLNGASPSLSSREKINELEVVLQRSGEAKNKDKKKEKLIIISAFNTKHIPPTPSNHRVDRKISKAEFKASSKPLFANLKILDLFSIYSLQVGSFMYLYAREDKGDREGIPHTHPIPLVIRLELFLTPQIPRGIRQQPII